MSIYPNAYYNYLKHRKSAYERRKESIKSAISKEYHRHGGVPGYRTIHYYIKQLGICISRAAVHKYMNKELKLSIVRRKYNYHKGATNNVFPNELNMNFTAEKRNRKWCTDFTYLFLSDGRKRYNCTILDVFDRSVVASITDKHITSDLAIRTLKKALESQPKSERDGILLHSDQGSQYTSNEFTEFCKSVNIKQSMSKAGYPYDNAPMERYYNTLKNELIYHYNYHTDEELNTAIENFAYVHYNHRRPHAYNNYKPPIEVRFS